MLEYLTEANLTAIQSILESFTDFQKPEDDSILQLRDSEKPDAPVKKETQFESEIEQYLSEIQADGLPTVAARHNIKLTVKGKIDKRTRIGRVLFGKVEEMEKNGFEPKKAEPKAQT